MDTLNAQNAGWFRDQEGVASSGAPQVRDGAVYAQWTSAPRAEELARLLDDAPGPRLARKARPPAEALS